MEPDKQINRKKLAEIVFKDNEKRLLLNKITHSAVNRVMIEQCVRLGFGFQQTKGLPKDCLAQRNAEVILLVIPLYFEAKMDLGLPVVNIGITDIEQQRQRITKRDGEEGVKRLDKQMSLEEREKRSQCCVRNDGDPGDAAQ